MKYPTIAACQIIGIDRQRFNEDVAKGIYTCAPPAHPKTGRFFDETDLCALFVYSFFQRVYAAMDEAGQRPGSRKPSISKRVAAMYACQIAIAIRSEPSAGKDRIDFPLNGFNNEWICGEADSPPAFNVSLSGPQISSLSSFATLCFSLEMIKWEVQARIAKWSGET
jgi:hypothetical protein